MLNTKKVFAFALPLLLVGLVNCGGAGSGGRAGSKGGSSGALGGASGAKGGTSGAKGGSTGSGGSAGGAGSMGVGGAGSTSVGGAGATGAGGTAGGSGGAPGAVVPALQGAIIHMSFDEGTGATLMDKSGNGNNGTIVQGATDASPVNPNPKWSAGRTGAATDRSWESNGVDEWAHIPRSDSIDMIGLNNAVSVSCWTYINAYNVTKPYNILVQRHEVGSRLDHFIMGMLNGAPISNVHFFGTSGPQNVPLGEWVHMAMTYDGVTQRMYMGGEEVTFLDTGWPLTVDETPVTLMGAINQSEVIEYVNGRIDEFQLYARALTPAEVAKLGGK